MTETTETPTKETKPKTKAAKPVYRTYEDYDFDTLQTYGGLDVIATSEILSHLMPKMMHRPGLLEDDGQGNRKPIVGEAPLHSYLNIIQPCLDFVIDLEIRGMAYDVVRNRQIHARMVEEINELEDKIFTSIGKRINLDSGVEVAGFLYEEKGFTAPFQTKGGGDATDGAALMTLAELDPTGYRYTTEKPELQFLADMAKRRDINSVHNTFIKNYIKDFVKSDGRIHPSYNLHGTSGFRISGDRPNLLQLPRAKHGYNVRECYTVGEGNVFVTWDFSSAEVKVMAALCRDENMVKACRDNLNFHAYSASLMHGIPYDEFMEVLEDSSHSLQKTYKQHRQIAKILTFSILYGSTAGGIAFQLSIPKEEAERLIAMYFSAYPGMRSFIERIQNRARWNQKVWTPFWQTKHEYATKPVFQKTASFNAALRNASNIIVQSPTSTMGLLCFAELDKAVVKCDAFSMANVYDSSEVESPYDRVAEVVELGFKYMNDWPVETFDWLDFPIGVECEIGWNWGQVEQVHRGVTQGECEAILERLKLEKTW